MTVPNYCRPCGENLLPEQPECPFCGQMAVPVDELSDAIAMRPMAKFFDDLTRPGPAQVWLDNVSRELGKGGGK